MFSPEEFPIRKAFAQKGEFVGSAMRAVKYFDNETSHFAAAEHKKNSDYMSVMNRLAKLPDFLDLLSTSRAPEYQPITQEPCFLPVKTCRVFMPFPFTNDMVLEFNSMVRILEEDEAPLDEHRFLDTLEPASIETTVGLILVCLDQDISRQAGTDNTPLERSLTAIALLKVLTEGITRPDDDILWEPQPAFTRIRSELVAEFSHLGEDGVSHARRSQDEALADLQGHLIDSSQQPVVDMLKSLPYNLQLFPNQMEREITTHYRPRNGAHIVNQLRCSFVTSTSSYVS